MKNYLLFMFLIWSSNLLGQQINVSFPSGNLNLNGTLEIPSGTGPFPIVILVHGSGPNDRDQTLHLTGGNSLCLYPNLYNDTIRNFKDLSQNFNSRGIATFRYDKRTFTYGNQLDIKKLTLNDFIIDIHSAIDYVKTQQNIDTNCISLIGHSQGSNLIPMVASTRTDISSLISIGGSASRIDSILALQFRNIYFKCLNDTIGGNSIYNQTLQDFDLIQNGSWNANTPYLGAYPKFWKNWMAISQMAIDNYKVLNLPTLFIHGNDDINIPLTDAQRFDNELTDFNTSLTYLPNVNHYMTNSTSPKVDTLIINTILNWSFFGNCSPTAISNQESINEIIWTQNENSLSIKSTTLNDPIHSLSVYDLSGKEFFNAHALSQSEIEISKSHFLVGIYIVHLTTEHKSYRKKLFIH